MYADYIEGSSALQIEPECEFEVFTTQPSAKYSAYNSELSVEEIYDRTEGLDFDLPKWSLPFLIVVTAAFIAATYLL